MYFSQNKKEKIKTKFRKIIRLQEYDYSKIGYYFLTICTHNRESILCNVICRGEHCSPKIELTQTGEVVDKYICEIEEKYKNVKIDEYIIMPNHIHIILIIEKEGEKSIIKIIQQFKGIVTKQVGYSIWQKSFYEHIIRNEKEYYKIKQYVQENPINWKKDKYY